MTFFALLAATGLRLSQACRLEIQDVDLDAGVLTVRHGKYRKSRLVPLHPSTTAALAAYAAERDACRPGSGRFFRTEHSSALSNDTVEKTFGQIRRRLGWTAEWRARRPRIMDLRHSFAIRRLLGWYQQEGADLNRKLLALSVYLGHYAGDPVKSGAEDSGDAGGWSCLFDAGREGGRSLLSRRVAGRPVDVSRDVSLVLGSHETELRPRRRGWAV